MFSETMQAPRGHLAMMQVLTLSRNFEITFFLHKYLNNILFTFQIDCEVTNTKLLHISEDSIPPFVNEVNRTAEKKAEPGKRAWRKHSKKTFQKLDDIDAILTKEHP